MTRVSKINVKIVSRSPARVKFIVMVKLLSGRWITWVSFSLLKHNLSSGAFSKLQVSETFSCFTRRLEKCGLVL